MDPSVPEDDRVVSAGRPRDPRIEDAMLEAARALLIEEGFNGLSLSAVAERADSNRPALYRRWRTKLDLVIDALRYGYSRERAATADATSSLRSARERFTHAVGLLDPQVVNPHAYVLQGDVLAEAERHPELLRALQENAVGPRCADFAVEVTALQREGAIRPEIDADVLSTMCFGSFFGAYLRTGPDGAAGFAGELADQLWQLVRARR